MTVQWNKEETKSRALTENTAQAVFKNLTDQESNRARWQNRWIWELLQNARDASKTSNNRLIVKIQYNSEKLVFLHNGGGFTLEQIAHLIYHGSTKVEDEETIGKYGSGFLTTHLLSPEITISGQLHDGQWFDFSLVRRPDSPTELRESMDEAWENFSPSVVSPVPMPEDFTTRFVYPIKEDNAANAVKSGITTLKQSAPYVVVFNQEFSRITIEDHHETFCIEASEPLPLNDTGIQQITVSQRTNENNTEMKYLLVQGEKASVTVPLKPNENNLVCLPIENIPRLFLGFPLVGTEDFSFPAVVNSLNFTPTEKRDGVYLWQSNNEANHNNQAIIEEACTLLVRLLTFVAASGWCHVHRLAEIPPIQERDWLHIDQLRKCLKSKLIDEILQTPVVITASGTTLTPQNAIPLQAKSDAHIETLWKLFESLEGVCKKLPKQDEAVGWCRAIQSWTNISEHIPPMLRNGGYLALYVEEKSKYTQGPNTGWGHLENLQKLLRPDVCVVDWLNQLYQFLMDDGFDNEIRTHRFIPDQAGFFHQLNETSRDTGIDEELKNIAELLGDSIRYKLRDIRLTPLVQEIEAGNMNNGFVASDIISRIRKRAEENPDDSFKEASVRMFAWITNQEEEDHSLLLTFPVFAEDGNSDNPTAHYLPNAPFNTDFSSLLLAPVRAWQEDLQPFKDLFPPNSILADAFFEAVSTPNTWQILNDQRLVKMGIQYRYTNKRQVNLKDFSPDVDRDDKDHIALIDSVTDIVKRSEIMSRVSDSRERAFLFWRFLTEWLIKNDVYSIELKEANCQCGGIHDYYSGAWVMPVRNNSWIRCEGNRRVPVTVESLASLLRDNEWQLDSLNQNPAVVNLLTAIGVTQFDLMREFVTAGSEKDRRIQENILTEIIVKAGGKLSQISALLQDLKEDKNLLQHLEERREQRRIMSENQHLGQQVEELVKENLEKEGFSVRPTGIGSDFEISDDTDNIITLDVARNSKNWLVEVKSTRSQSVDVTPVQAKTADDKGDAYLLCIVPLEQENGEPDLEIVRKEMRFLKNIRAHVAPLCEYLISLEELQSGITDKLPPGVKLVITEGKVRIRVNQSVWENNGFPIEDLAARLI